MLASSDSARVSRIVVNSNNSSSSKPCRAGRRWSTYPGERVAKKYEHAAIRRAEFRKLKAIVPAVAGKRSVSKLAVVEEAIRYIDELHALLAERICGTDSRNMPEDDLILDRCHRPFLDIVSPNLFLSRLCNSLPTIQREDTPYDVIRSNDDVMGINRRTRKALDELPLLTKSNFADAISNF